MGLSGFAHPSFGLVCVCVCIHVYIYTWRERERERERERDRQTERDTHTSVLGPLRNLVSPKTLFVGTGFQMLRYRASYNRNSPREASKKPKQVM